MPEDVVWEELETLRISVQGVLQVCTGCRDQEASKVHPLTPHFIVSVARGPEVVNLRSLQVLVEMHITQKALCSASAANMLAIHIATAVMLPSLLLVVRLAS
jgi:hypothetical protein